MNITTLRSFLGWCMVIDYGVLLFWTLVFWLAHDWHYGLTNRFFAVSVETYDLINLCGISFFKIAIILLNLVPYFALLLAGRKSWNTRSNV